MVTKVSPCELLIISHPDDNVRVGPCAQPENTNSDVLITNLNQKRQEECTAFPLWYVKLGPYENVYILKRALRRSCIAELPSKHNVKSATATGSECPVLKINFPKGKVSSS